MARHPVSAALTSLALALAVALTAACTTDFYSDAVDPKPAHPVQVYLQDTWDDADGFESEHGERGGEQGRILRCIDEWNFRHRLTTGTNEDLIVFMGYHHDPDGFTLEDLDDGRIVVYKVEHSLGNPDIAAMLESAGYEDNTTGNAIRADAHPPDPNRPGYESSGEVVILLDGYKVTAPGDPPWPEDPIAARALHLALTWDTVCHEFGHVLGVNHYNVGKGVMLVARSVYSATELTEEELERVGQMPGMLTSWSTKTSKTSPLDYAAYQAR